MDILCEIINSIPEVSDEAFIALCVASFFTAMVSGAFGLGGGVLLLSLMAFVLPSLAIVPIHGVIQLVANFTRASMMWRHINFTWMLPFAIGTMIGAAIGGQIVFAMPKHFIQGTIGVFILYSLWGPAMKAFNSSWFASLSIGGFASVATMFVGGTGPMIAPFIKATTNERRMTVATQAAFMSCQHSIKILAFGVLGFAFSSYTLLIAIMILFTILGTWSGKTILAWMPDQVFRMAFNLGLTLLALNLLYSAISTTLS